VHLKGLVHHLPSLSQPAGLNTRRLAGGLLMSFAAGRIGRGAKLPPQFGQTPLSLLSTQSRQNVHSKVQIIASAAEGGKSLSQHSQLGRNSSMACALPYARALMRFAANSHVRRRCN
jgi:hypothetical protein